MSVYIVGVSIVLFLLSIISESNGAGCYGYRMKVFDITNRCPEGNEVIEFKNFKLDFSNDCKLIANGCITLKKTFNYAQSNWHLRHGLVYKEGEIDDACKIQNPRPAARTVLDNLGFGRRCADAKPQTRCYNRTPLIDITPYASQLQMASGPTNMVIETDHADAGKDCVKVRVNIGRKLSDLCSKYSFTIACAQQ